jgi:hypothetical protein
LVAQIYRVLWYPAIGKFGWELRKVSDVLVGWRRE